MSRVASLDARAPLGRRRPGILTGRSASFNRDQYLASDGRGPAPSSGRTPSGPGELAGQATERLDPRGGDVGEAFPEERLEGRMARMVEELERVGGERRVVADLLD